MENYKRPFEGEQIERPLGMPERKIAEHLPADLLLDVGIAITAWRKQKRNAGLPLAGQMHSLMETLGREVFSKWGEKMPVGAQDPRMPKLLDTIRNNLAPSRNHPLTDGEKTELDENFKSYFAAGNLKKN